MQRFVRGLRFWFGEQALMHLSVFCDRTFPLPHAAGARLRPEARGEPCLFFDLLAFLAPPGLLGRLLLLLLLLGRLLLLERLLGGDLLAPT